MAGDLKRVAIAASLAAALFAAAATEGSGQTRGGKVDQLPSVEEWPESWRALYGDVQEFVEMRRAHWPQAHLEVDLGGRVTQVIVPSGWKDNLSWMFYRNGNLMLGRNASDEDSYLPYFGPGQYTVSLKAVTSQGYQHISPTLRYVIVSTNPLRIAGPASTAYSHPKNPVGIAREWLQWPNDWAFAFEDYWSYSAKTRAAFRDRSATDPRLELKITRGGVVTRPVVGEKEKDLILWRVYHEGRLRVEEPAAGRTDWKCRFGPGHYAIMIVAPARDGGLLLCEPFTYWFPDEGDGVVRTDLKDSDRDGIPDYWERKYRLDPNDPDDALLDADGNGRTNLEDHKRNPEVIHGRTK